MNYPDIVAEARLLSDTDSTSLPDAVVLRRISSALEEVVGDIIGCDGSFRFDDSNYTTLPIGFADLVAGQEDFSFDTTFLDIVGVSVKDSNGRFQALRTIDQREMIYGTGNLSGQLSNVSVGKLVDPTQFFPTNGMPLYYDKEGQSVKLYPQPSAGAVTLAQGLKVFFQRTASLPALADLSDSSKSPGFRSTYHHLLAYMVALPYCETYKKDRVPTYSQKVMELKQKIQEHYGRRAKDEARRMVVAFTSNR